MLLHVFLHVSNYVSAPNGCCSKVLRVALAQKMQQIPMVNSELEGRDREVAVAAANE